MSGNDLPKIIDKSPADIDAAIAAIEESNMEKSTKDFAVSCIRLAVWLPKALLEYKIKLSNLRKLIFGQGKKCKYKLNKNLRTKAIPEIEDNNDNTKPDDSMTSHICICC